MEEMPGWVAALGAICTGVCVLPFLILFVYVVRRTQRAIDSAYQPLLDKWAAENGWEILHRQRREWGSPWMFSKSANQPVYYVTVGYQEGGMRTRRAWVRCGHWFWGWFVEKIEYR